MSSTLKNSTSLFTLSARIRSTVFGLVTALIVTSCMPLVHLPGKPVVSPVLGERFFLTADGARLPVRSWMPENGRPKGLIIAVHGFNDYSKFFSSSGEFLSELGIASYAFDQRGFGDSPDAGLWFGVEAYVNDLVEFSRLVSHKHPSLPVYLLGESMGGAVVIVAMNSVSPPEVDGVILSAPAVWGRETMPWYQRALLWFTVHTMPWMKLTGEGLKTFKIGGTESLPSTFGILEGALYRKPSPTNPVDKKKAADKGLIQPGTFAELTAGKRATESIKTHAIGL